MINDQADPHLKALFLSVVLKMPKCAGHVQSQQSEPWKNYTDHMTVMCLVSSTVAVRWGYALRRNNPHNSKYQHSATHG